MEKFKIGTKVRMYGAGYDSYTFWDGNKATVVGYEKYILICVPDEYLDEKHYMHQKQCRRIKKKGKEKKLTKIKNKHTGSEFRLEDFT
jgi:hypothetical protein